MAKRDGGLGALPVATTCDAALEEARSLGCEVAEVRVEKIRSQMTLLRDCELETSLDDTEVGVGIRVVHNGSFGFAATVELGADAGAAVARAAVATARATESVGRGVGELAFEPVHGEVTWIAPYEVDPTSISAADKVELLESWSRRLLDSKGVDHVTAEVLAVVEDKHFADLGGNRITQHRVRVHPVVEAVAVNVAGGFESMRSLAPPVGRGWEYLTGPVWDFDAEIAAMPGLLAEKLRAPSVEPGSADLVIDPTNLWLTIHESVGHATELDRALGYEAAYAGTSFATFDRLGSLQYGSPVMSVTGDRTEPFGLATVAFDDEGVAAQKFDLVRDGVLVGYQLDRRIAKMCGFARSNGCAFADSPMHVPMQRMANVSLAPSPGDGPSTDELVAGVEHGYYIVGDKSWSIDMQRHNFQFTGQRFFRIEHGRLAGQVRDLAYQSTTTEFWGRLEAVGGRSSYLLGGAFNCGKGQPGQVATVSHGCPAAVFRGINVLNTRSESGR